MSDLAELLRKHRTIHVNDAHNAIDNAIADLAATKTQVGEAIARAHRDADDGFKPSSLGGRAPTTVLDDDGNPVALSDYAVGEKVAIALEAGHDDMIRRRATTMIEAIARCELAARVAIAGARDLVPLPQGEAARLIAAELGSKAVACANTHCRRMVECTRADPLRSGRCTNCAVWRRDHAGEERPREICDKELERDIARKKPRR